MSERPTLAQLREDLERGFYDAKPIFPKPEKKRPATTPLADLEKAIYRKVQSASFPPATASKRFMQGNADVLKISDKGRAFMAYIAHRFRRQYALTAEELLWVNEWKKPAESVETHITGEAQHGKH